MSQNIQTHIFCRRRRCYLSLMCAGSKSLQHVTLNIKVVLAMVTTTERRKKMNIFSNNIHSHHAKNASTLFLYLTANHLLNVYRFMFMLLQLHIKILLVTIAEYLFIRLTRIHFSMFLCVCVFVCVVHFQLIKFYSFFWLYSI